MGAARIAAMLVVLTAATLLSQQTSRARIDIQVTDENESRISHASVFVDVAPDDSIPHPVVDMNGRALIEIEAGAHALWVTANRFLPKRVQINLRAASVEPLVVQLSLRPIHFEPIPIEHSILFNADIPLETLAELSSTARPIRHHRVHLF